MVRYLPAAWYWRVGARGGGGTADGNGTRGTPGVDNSPANQGRADANALAAKGQSCLPACDTTAQSMPLALPSPHSALAANIWSPGLDGPRFTAGVTCGRACWPPLM